MKHVREAQEKIFRGLYESHRGTPMAVSSESHEHKELRYGMLSELFLNDNDFSVHDVGCGVADFWAYLKSQHPEKIIRYSGTEILIEYQREASQRFSGSPILIRDLADKPGNDMYDYVVMSGVFHQKQQTRIPVWEKFMQALLRNTYQMATKGIGFNIISPFVDFYQEQVYYCNLNKLIQFINDELSRFFEIRHNYALFELTVFIYKPEHVHSKYPQKIFEKYFATGSGDKS
jgi:hypothetical protein